MQYRLYPIVIALLLVVVTLTTLPMTRGARREQEGSSVEIPINVLQKAIRFVKQQQQQQQQQHNYKDTSQILQRLELGDIHSLYEVAKAMNQNNDNKDDRQTSMEIWHALADADDGPNNNSGGGGGAGGHILSQIALGFAYSEHDKSRAVSYFVQAGEGHGDNVPHQAALYNAGRLLAEPELEDFVKALAYLRAAYNVAESHPEYSTLHLTETSKFAYERLSDQLVALVKESTTIKGSVISIQQVADMFLYANIEDFPPVKSKEERIWHSGMQSLQSQKWEMAGMQFEKLEKTSKAKLSHLQIALLHILKEYCRKFSGIDRGEEL